MATSMSMWFNAWWHEANPTGGAKQVSINWFKGFTAAELDDPKCLSLINSARRLVDAMRYSTTTKKTSLITVFGSRARKLLHLVTWMYRNTVWSFSDITPEIADWYKSDLLETGPESLVEFEEDGDDPDEINPGRDADEITVNVLAAHLNMLVHVFQLSEEFKEFPELRIPEHPFRGQSVKSLAESLAISTDGWIPRVPDEVLNPLMQVALNWIDVYAEDVFFSQNEYLYAMDSRRAFRGNNYAEYTDPKLLRIVFDGRGTLKLPWRRPFLPSIAHRTGPASPDDAMRGPATQLRSLIHDLEAAASVSVQVPTGVRVSEFLAAKAEPRQSNGYPACLIQRESSSGLYDLFYLSSRTFKGEEDEEGLEKEWLIGVRPAGSNHIPIAARGILVLDKLFSPWRERFRSDYLTVSLGLSGSMPHSVPENTKPLAGRLARITRSFVDQHVELPQEYANWELTTHQYRKAFCQDMIRINPKSLPAVQEHYGHTSSYLTDRAYSGNDVTMLKMIDDVATREAAKMMVDRVYANAPMAGKLAEIIDGRERAIRDLLEGADSNERRITALAEALSTEGIMLFTSDYLDCFFRPQHAMCHHDFLGEFDKDATRPLKPFRTPKNCSVCANGLINRHHIPYWIEQFRTNNHVKRANEAIGDSRVAAVASARAAQARSVLRRIGGWPIDDNA
jgi:integrase